MTSRNAEEYDGVNNNDDSCCYGCKKVLKTLLGIIFAALTGILFATATTAVNIAEDHGIPTFQILFLAYITLFTFAILLCVASRENVLFVGAKTIIVLFSTGIFRWSALTLSYFAYQFVEFGDVTAIVRGITPVLTPLLAFFFLKESWTIVEILVTVMNIIGVVAVAGPFNTFVETSHSIEVGQYNSSDEIIGPTEPTNSNLAVGYALTVSTGVSFSLAYVLARSLGDSGTVSCRLFYDALTGVILSSVPLFVVTTNSVWSMAPQLAVTLALYCVVDAVALYAYYRSFQLEVAATVAMLLNIEVFATYVYQATIFDTTPNPFEIAGATIIVLSSVLVAFIKWKRNQAKEKEERKTLLHDYASRSESDEPLTNNNPHVRH